MTKIAGFGIANVDFIFGNAPRMPQLGEEIYSGSCSKQLGGGPVATLILLAKLGLPAQLATYIGKGSLSKFLIAELENSQVNYINMLATDEEEPVTLSCIVSCASDRGIVSYKPEDAAFAVDKQKIYEFYSGSKIAFLTLEQRELCKPLKEAGSIIVLDSAWNDKLSLDWYYDIFPYIDYFIPNEMEAKKITGANTAEEALDILGQYLPIPIVKKGNEGCLLKQNGEVSIIPPFPVKHIDSTGAGDAFAAGFMYGLYKDYEISECIRLGNITGGNAVTKIGCLAADINEQEMLEKYEEFK